MVYCDTFFRHHGISCEVERQYVPPQLYNGTCLKIVLGTLGVIEFTNKQGGVFDAEDQIIAAM